MHANNDVFSPTELVFRVKLRICGDLRRVEGPCIFILNHRTRFDWLFFWSYVIRMGSTHKHRIVLKESLKKVPGFGESLAPELCTLAMLCPPSSSSPSFPPHLP